MSQNAIAYAPDTPFDHKHIMLKATGLRNAPTDSNTVKLWLQTLVEKVNMKTLMGPFAEYCHTVGNEGVTGIVVIETSHASIHIWSEVENPFLQMDLYSCATFDPEIVTEHVQQFLPQDITYMVVDRNSERLFTLENTLITQKRYTC